MAEIWKIIDACPFYSVSNYGQIANNRTGKILHQSLTDQGIVKIVLRDNQIVYTRSIKVLVAKAFVDGQTELFNTPIQLDGDQENNYASNLVWRPRWFAWKYSRQFKDIPAWINLGPIREIKSGDFYNNIYDVCVVNGLLFNDVRKSVTYLHEVEIFPTRQVFELVK